MNIRLYVPMSSCVFSRWEQVFSLLQPKGSPAVLALVFVLISVSISISTVSISISTVSISISVVAVVVVSWAVLAGKGGGGGVRAAGPSPPTTGGAEIGVRKCSRCERRDLVPKGKEKAEREGEGEEEEEMEDRKCGNSFSSASFSWPFSH